MGFLRRLWSGTEPPVQNLELNVNVITHIRDDAVVQVVGEAYRQGDVARARPPSAAELPPGIPPPQAGYYKAVMLREPTNQFDSNAIAVLLWAGDDWAMTGYLSRFDALAFGPLFEHLQQVALEHGDQGRAAICCDAAVISERDGRGVILHLGSPGECAADLATEDLSPSADHPWMGKAVVFTGQMATRINGVPIDRLGQEYLARWGGCVPLPRMTKKTDALIVADPREATANLQKAKEYGVPIVLEPDFLVAIGIPADAISKATDRWARG